MITLRPAAERGHTQVGWLDSRHSFSFGHYHDPEHMGFRTLRVINEDRVAPGAGFGTHPHRDMEILTYVVSGALEHKDSMGSSSVLHAGEFQRMSAGTGVTHSEFNHSAEEPVHFLQMWVLPEREGLEPGYEQKPFPDQGVQLVAARDGRDGALTIHQDVNLWLASLWGAQRQTISLAPGRHAWIQMVEGEAEVAGHALHAGDGAAATGVAELTLAARTPARMLVFDVA
jgi:redox-sensitive bicupin YhaK (pirin superfamily)